MNRTLAGFLIFAGIACAGPTLTFTAGAGGTASYAGGVAPINASNIPIGSITPAGTIINGTQVLNITGGTLSFTTGDFTGSNAGILNFAGPGSFTLTGSISSLGLTNATLASGTFSGASFDPTAGTVDMFLGSGNNSTSPALVNYYFGFGSVVTWDFALHEYVDRYRGAGKIENTGFNLNGITGSMVDSATTVGRIIPPPAGIVDTAETPEPSSMILFGTTAGVLAYLAKRRRRGLGTV